MNWTTLAAAALLLLHHKSLPFVWHLRIFLRPLLARWRTRSLFLPRTSPRIQQSPPHLLLDTLPIGRDLFTDTVTQNFRVGFDDGDFFGHLSNSSYPKNLDMARMAYASYRLPLFFADGGWIALGSIQFKFIREIPLLARYQVRVSVLGFGEKWFYVRNQFVSPNRGKKSDATETVYCESVSKHCFKHGRRTIPPWLVFATAGYAPKESATPRANWEKVEAIREKLVESRRDRKGNLLAVYAKDAGTEREEEWMRKESWDVREWDRHAEVDQGLLAL